MIIFCILVYQDIQGLLALHFALSLFSGRTSAIPLDPKLKGSDCNGLVQFPHQGASAIRPLIRMLKKVIKRIEETQGERTELCHSTVARAPRPVLLTKNELTL